MKDLTKEQCWDILLGNPKLSLPEIMMLFGVERKEVTKTILDLEHSDRHDVSNFFFLSTMFIKKVYYRLVELKEIDATRIFNLRSKSYDTHSNPHVHKDRNGDMGVMGKDNFFYTTEGWVKI